MKQSVIFLICMLCYAGAADLLNEGKRERVLRGSATYNKEKYSVVTITHNVHSQKSKDFINTEWFPKMLLKTGQKPDFVFVTLQEAQDKSDSVVDAWMSSLGYVKLNTNHGTWKQGCGDFFTIANLYYNPSSPALSGFTLRVRTDLGADKILVNQPSLFQCGKSVIRTGVRIQEPSGAVVGDLIFYGTHMFAHEDGFWKRYDMWKKIWYDALVWSSSFTTPTAVFTAGDMNWRTSIGEWQNQEAPFLMSKVDCSSRISDFKCWAGPRGKIMDFTLDVKEANVHFQPTYKRPNNDEPNCYEAADSEPGYLDGSSDWEGAVKYRQQAYPATKGSCYYDKDSKTPSWADRVMWYPFQGSEVRPRYYTDFYNWRHSKSDHRMVILASDVYLPRCGADMFNGFLCRLFPCSAVKAYCAKTCCGK